MSRRAPIAEPDSSLVSALVPSPNIEPRAGARAPTILLLHYTGLTSVEQSIEVLSRPDCKVSCHYIVGEDGRITQMVAESMRAWHAGVSSWQAETDINSASIGIEIQNAGHSNGYPDFPEVQMRAVTALCRDVVERHRIVPERVLAHSDVAPQRKIDPGEKFDWAGLWREGVGHWVPPVPLDPDEAGRDVAEGGAQIERAQALLAAYGYGFAETGDRVEAMRAVVRAFQRHFRPTRVDGRVDRSTLLTLEQLIAALSQMRTS